MLEELKKKVYEANLKLVEYGLVVLTWGNASEIDRESGLFVIKPSGVPYDKMTADDMVVMDLNGNKVEGKLNPSSDTPTHLALYNSFQDIGGIVHTHSSCACSWAQAGRDVPAYGTTHADFAYGPVPCARGLKKDEVQQDYELNTGRVIVEEFRARGIEPAHVPAVICRSHGPFAWGADAAEAVYHAAVLEEVAHMALLTLAVDADAMPAPQHLQDKHFMRKHGPQAYYGQG